MKKSDKDVPWCMYFTTAIGVSALLKKSTMHPSIEDIKKIKALFKLSKKKLRKKKQKAYGRKFKDKKLKKSELIFHIVYHLDTSRFAM